MAQKSKDKKRADAIAALKAQQPLLEDFERVEVEHHFEGREPLRKTLLNTLKLSGEDLVDLALNGSVVDAQAFAQLADDALPYAEILRHVADLIERAGDRLRVALELRDDYKELFEYSAAQLRKGLS